MAPPGLPSFCDPLPRTMTIGTSFLSLSHSALSVTYPAAAAAMSPQARSIQADHDYVIKAKVEDAQLEPEPEPLTDAMLSSSADIDLETMMGDIDFTDDLADLNFTLNDLAPDDDFPMEDSFQDFIDSALENSFRSFQWEAEETKAREKEQKEEYMMALGLQPVQNRQEDDNSCEGMTACDNNNNSVENFNKLPTNSLHPMSPSVPVSVSAVPTKQCTCSHHSSGPRAVYTLAGQRSPDTLTTSTAQFPIPPVSPSAFRNSVHTNNCSSNNSTNIKNESESTRRRPVIGSCLNCIQNRDVLEKFSTPLTIDVSLGNPDLSNDIVLQAFQQSGHFRNDEFERLKAWERQQQQVAPYGETEELLQWLNASEASTSPTSDCGQPQFQSTPNSQIQNTNENLGSLEESFMDLEEFLNSQVKQPAIPPQPVVQHDHTYQKITLHGSTEPSFDTDDFMELRLPFLDNVDDRSEFRRESIQKLRDTTFELSIPSPLSPLSSSSSSSSSPYPSPDPTKRYNDAVSESEKNQLDILNFFSDDLSSNMLSADSPLNHFRFM